MNREERRLPLFKLADQVFKGKLSFYPLLGVGYLLPFLLFLGITLLIPPIEWGWDYASAFVVGLLCLHQLLLVIPLWRSARRSSNRLARATGYIASVVAATGFLAFGFLLIPTYVLTVGGGGIAFDESGSEVFDADIIPTLSSSDLDLGSHVSGPRIHKETLGGKAVVVEFWGAYCSPCFAAMPHLVEIRTRYSDEQLVIVANQVWKASDDKVRAIFRKHVPNGEGITVINQGQLTGVDVKAVPIVFVFSQGGKLIWKGHPSDKAFEAVVAQACSA